MGADLIGTGFTVDVAKDCHLDALNALIDGLTDEQLDSKFLDFIDPGGILDEPDPDDVRNILKAGAKEFQSARRGHRYTIEFSIPNTALWLIWAGGSSWGDDPFEGWGSLELFVSLCEHNTSAAYLAGIVSVGIPDPKIIAQYAEAAKDL